MSLLYSLADPAAWEKFYAYKTSLACPKIFAKELRSFIDDRAYLPVLRHMASGEPFPLPRKAVISKLSTQKKRIVYIYPQNENIVLKFLTYLLLRRYDGIFADNLYSFRPGRSAKDAFRSLLRVPGISQMSSYKADVHNYFNSIPVNRLLPMLAEVTADDPELFTFLRGLLEEPRVLYEGEEIAEEKGIMAGTPLASFYANLYLKDLDEWFRNMKVPYARYSDDMILFGRTREETEAYARLVRRHLSEKGLAINPDKEEFRPPEEGFVFLGFSQKEGVVDIAPASVKKMKQKMRRKARALRRWSLRNGAEGEAAAKAFIRVFNRKLFEGAKDSDFTWSQWFFSVINTDSSLREIDHYAQDCIRYLVSGKHTKGRFNVRYEDIQKLGCKNLVHEYYAYHKKTEEKSLSPVSDA